MAGKLDRVSPADREQRLVFGEIAREYASYRPSYPEALFDLVVEYGDLRAGDLALEIGAGTGKATVGFLQRGLEVRALEPSPGMAAILRSTGVPTDEALFESWDPPLAGFRLVYAAQAWHWVGGDDRYQRVAAALEPGGTAAFFWNKGRPWTGGLGRENDAAYAEIAPELLGGQHWQLGWVADGLAASGLFSPTETRVVTWSCTYTRDDWVNLLGTHSDHRMLPEAQRTRLHAAVGDVIDRHSGRVEVTYDLECFLSRRV